MPIEHNPHHHILLLLFLIALNPFFVFPLNTHPTTLNFDDLSPPSGLLTPPIPYHTLHFHNSLILTPLSPSLTNILTPADHNCALSAPNALLGSRGLSFSLDNNQTSFTLSRFWVKPLNFPPPGSVRVTVFGYRHHHHHHDSLAAAAEEEEPALQWHVDFPAGYHLPFLVRMAEYSGQQWDGLRAVEMVAEYGVQKLDWELCLDDLEVVFEGEGEVEGRGEGEGAGGRRDGGQAVLADGS